MTPSRLPGAECAVVEQTRVERYLLDPAHKDGGSKAKFFLARGFQTSSWQDFARALETHARSNPVTQITETRWGVRYRVDCNLPTPDGVNPCIRTVWQIAYEGDCPRLLTSHPL